MANNSLSTKSERRRFRRVSDAIALKISSADQAANDESIDGADLPDFPTHVVSLSSSGLKCYHEEPFNDGDIVRLSIALFPEKTRLELKARVVNSGEEQARSKDNRFFAGLAFEGITDEQQGTILEHIDRVARQSFGGSVKLVYKDE